MMLKEIFKQVIHGKPHLHIGKNGVSEAILAQIDDIFRTKKVIKIRFLSTEPFLNVRDAVESLSKRLNCKIIDIRGHTCVLLTHKKQKPT